MTIQRQNYISTVLYGVLLGMGVALIVVTTTGWLSFLGAFISAACGIQILREAP